VASSAGAYMYMHLYMYIKGRSCSSPLFSVELLIQKRREFNLGTHLAFLDYVKAFDKVKKDKLFEIFQSKNIPNLL
jgi:hypothetical protein